MARPQKQGLNYFSFDVSFFSDIKIRKLIKYHGIQAVPVYEILLCRIYESGYYMEWDDDIPFTISEVSHLEEDYICKVIDFLVEVGLFDKSLYGDYHVLTSRSIQERYISACSLTKRKVSMDAPYLLIDIKGDRVSSNKTTVNTEQTLFSSEETQVLEEETTENSGKSTQIKEKEDKKQIKEEKKEEEKDKKEVKEEKKEEEKEEKKEEVKEEKKEEEKKVKEGKKEEGEKGEKEEVVKKEEVNKKENTKEEKKEEKKEDKTKEGKEKGEKEKEKNNEMEIEKEEKKEDKTSKKKEEENNEKDEKTKETKGKDKKDEMEIENGKEEKNKNDNEIKEAKKDNEVSENNNKIDKNIPPRGLNNIGATCYMNSVLQCFYHVFDLSNELLKLNIKEIDEDKMPMTSAYLEVINKLSFSKKQSVSPYQFKMIISNNPLFQGIGANDSKSLTLYILETLNEEFNENKIKIKNTNVSNKIRELKDKDKENIVNVFNNQYNSIVADLFYGLKMTTYKCLTCNDAPSDYQLFNIINLSIEKTVTELKKKKPKVDLLECLRVEQNKQQFNGDNQLFCDKCDKMADGESENRIYMSPKIMILFLDRGRFNRFRCEVTFPEKLDFKEFEEVDGGEYHLVGVIEHLGPSSNSGHFIAVCKHFDDQWYMFSDSSISEPQKKYKKYGEPYLLFYKRD